MEALNELLARLPNGELGTVVVVGAGYNEAAQTLAHRANAIVLVEGDPDAIAELQAQAASSGPKVRVVGVPVSAEGGVLSWNRYNLRWLNGPLDASGLVRWYPRLQALGALPLRAKALRELLAEVDLIADARAPNVLVLDVPGQEGPLLEAVDTSVLESFDWIAVTSCTEPPEAGWCPPSRSGEILRRFGFESTGSDGNEDAQWPCRLYRLDRAAINHRRTVAALRVSSERVLELEEETAALRSHRGELEQAVASREAALEQLRVRNNDIEARLQDRQARIDGLDAALALAQKLAADRGGELQVALRNLKDTESASRQQAAASADRIAALEAAAADAATQSREQQERQAAIRAELVVQAGALSRRLAEREAALAEREAALENAQARLVNAESAAAAAQKTAADQGKLMLNLKADQDRQQRANDAEKAEAVKRIATIEAERDQLLVALADQKRVCAEERAARDIYAAELNSLHSRLHVLESELSKAGKESAERSDRIETLERDLQRANTILETQQTALAAAGQEAEGLRADMAKSLERHEQALATARKDVQAAHQAAKAEVDRFKDEMDQLRLRQRLLGEEMIRAEGQIDLIKDVLLRETGL